MAAAKQPNSVRGAITDSAAPPFATRSGQATVTTSGKAPAIDPSTGRPTNAAPQPGRNFVADPTDGVDADAEDRSPLEWPGPTTAPGGAELRVDRDSIVSGGLFPELRPGAASRSSDPGPQPASLPWRNLK